MHLAKHSKSMESSMKNTWREYLRCAGTTHYFSNLFTYTGLALTHLPRWRLRRDHPWVPHVEAEFRGRDLERATNDICIAPRLARFGAQSMDGLMSQLSAAVQVKSITDYAQNLQTSGHRGRSCSSLVRLDRKNSILHTRRIRCSPLTFP